MQKRRGCLKSNPDFLSHPVSRRHWSISPPDSSQELTLLLLMVFLLLKFQKLDCQTFLLCDAPALYLGVQFRILSVTPILSTCFMVSLGYSTWCSGTEKATTTFFSSIFLEFAIPTVLNLIVSRSPSLLHNPSWCSVVFELINFLSKNIYSELAVGDPFGEWAAA
jgi:hypothetical protein